ncbi:MAG: outer membrane beta-barrel protein [Immundisolibacteraceae bacterium]|nr:outer membrane beta-barrel protein [Immundisolibacteraceae bacterium]
MNNKWMSGIAIAAFGVVMAAPVMADDSYYLAVGGGTTEADDTCGDLGGAGFTGSCDDRDRGWKVVGGYQIDENFGVEVFYADLGKADAVGTIGAVAATADVDIDGFGVSFTGTLPLTEQLSLLGRVGMFRWDANGSGSLGAVSVSADDDGTDLAYGLGVQYSVTEHLGFRVEWERFEEVADDDMQLISASVVWGF